MAHQYLMQETARRPNTKLQQIKNPTKYRKIHFKKSIENDFRTVIGVMEKVWVLNPSSSPYNWLTKHK